MMDADDEATQMRYAHAIAEWAEAGGYDQEVVWDVVAVSALGVPFAQAQYRELATLSGGEQKRIVLEALFRGPDDVLLLDEPDNYLDVPGKLWLEERLQETPKTVLLISHDRELLANAADVIVTIELGGAGNTAWTHPGSFTTYHEARAARFDRLDELTRRWDEEHAKLKALVQYYKTKAAYNDGLASRLQAARTRLAKFEEVGPARGAADQAGGDDAPARWTHRQACRGVRGAVAVHARPVSSSWRRSTSRSGSATAWRCWAPTARASRTSCACSPPVARSPTWSTSRSRTW